MQGNCKTHPVFWKHESQSERQCRIEANQLSLEMHSLCQLPLFHLNTVRVK